jgi:hypothetical protein
MIYHYKFIFLTINLYVYLGFSQTRGALKAMTVGALRQLIAYYQPGSVNESKAEVLKRLCVLFGMPL